MVPTGYATCMASRTEGPPLRPRVKPLPGLVGLVLAVLVVFAPTRSWAQGGPPLITDDPDTPGPGYWEINISAFLESSRRERRGETPRLDLNYGLGRRIQLKFEVPWVDARESGGPLRTGVGNSIAGVKWRFLGEERHRLAWSVYPQLELNTDHASVVKGLVQDGPQLLLPTELTLELGQVEINGELGRNFAGHGAGGWLYGISMETTIARRLELLGELHGERRGAEPTELIVNVGARRKITDQLIVMLAAGRAVSGSAEQRPRLLLYAGLQLNLPGFFRFDQPEARGADVRPGDGAAAGTRDAQPGG